MEKLSIYERGSIKKKFNLLNVKNYGSLNYISVQHVLCSLLTSLRYSGGIYFFKVYFYPGPAHRKLFIKGVEDFYIAEFFETGKTPVIAYFSNKYSICKHYDLAEHFELVVGFANINKAEAEILCTEYSNYISRKFLEQDLIRWSIVLSSPSSEVKTDKAFSPKQSYALFFGIIENDLEIEDYAQSVLMDYFTYEDTPALIFHHCMPNTKSLVTKFLSSGSDKHRLVTNESFIFCGEDFKAYDSVLACNYFPNICSIPTLANSDLSKFYYLVSNYFYYKKYFFFGFNFSILYNDNYFSIKSTKRVLREDLVLMDKYLTKTYGWQYTKGYIIDLHEKLFIKGNYQVDTAVFSYMSMLPNLHLFEEEAWPKIKYIRALKYFMWNCLQFIMLSYTLISVITQISFFIVGHDLSHVYFTFFLITFFLHVFLDFVVYTWNFPTEEKFIKYVENYVSDRFNRNSSRNALLYNVHYYFNKLRYLLKGLHINPSRVVSKTDRYLGKTQQLEKMYLVLEKSSPSLLINGVVLDLGISKTVKGKIAIKKKKFSS